jgi:methionyl-tRNA formyltransferase
MVVCDYGQILSAETLSISSLGGINLHGSLLPKYRGAAPVNWAIWKGETETGVTVLHMTPRLDAGPALVQSRLQIGSDETAAELEPRLAHLGVQAVREAIQLLASWDRRSPLGTPQDPAQATRAPRLKKKDGQVNWAQTAAEIYRQFRAVQPWPGLFTYWAKGREEPLRILLSRIRVEPQPSAGLKPGQLVTDGRSLTVATAHGLVAIDQLQPAGKRVMAIGEFLRGHKLQPGDSFVTSAE